MLRLVLSKMATCTPDLAQAEAFARALTAEILAALAAERAPAAAEERPLDTSCAYFGRRYCTSCCKEWGDVELLMDLVARRNPAEPRHQAYRRVHAAGLVQRGACCTRAIMGPGQHNVEDSAPQLFLDYSSRLGPPPSALALTQARPRLAPLPPGAARPVAPLSGPLSPEAIEALLAP